MTMRARTLSLVLALAAPALAGAAPAQALPSFHAKRMVVSFDVHAIEVTDWRVWTSSGTSWTHAIGTQTLGWDTTRTVKADVTAYTHVRGVDLPPLAIAQRRLPVARLAARRTVDWTDHREYPCDSEGGCGGQSTRVVETHPAFTCPARRVRTTLGFGLDDHDRLSVAFGDTGTLWSACPPSSLPTADVPNLALRGGVGRLQRLRVGRTLTLKGSLDTGVAGERTATEAIVKVRRLR